MTIPKNLKTKALAQEITSSAACYRDDDGMWVIRGNLSKAEGELLIKALDAIQEQCGPAGENKTPKKTLGQKRADALTSLAEHYIATTQEGLRGAKQRRVQRGGSPRN